MLIGVLFLVASAMFFCAGWLRRERPLDDEELRLIRRLSDDLRRDQIHPFN